MSTDIDEEYSQWPFARDTIASLRQEVEELREALKEARVSLSENVEYEQSFASHDRTREVIARVDAAIAAATRET